MSPKQALKLGATHLVIGRDITKGKKTRKNKNTDKYIISRKKKRGIN